MSFFVIRLGNSDLGWIELSRSFSVGRNSLCDLALRDALLSRRHFQVELDGDDWVVEDLDSKNGTWRGDEPVTREVLHQGDLIRAGRYSFEFQERMPEGGKKYLPQRLSRPVDPHEALRGTMNGEVYVEESPQNAMVSRPSPRPIPRPFPSVGLLEDPVPEKMEAKPRPKLPIILNLPDEYDLQPSGDMVRRPASPVPADPTPTKKRRGWGWLRWELNLDLAAFVLILALLAAGLYAIREFIPHW
jgi:predicted component of type VI protein secretion system